MSGINSIISSIPEDISGVVHIGAGYCTQSELYKELGVNSVIFVEPDAQLFHAASRKFLHSPHITVLQKTVAGKSEERILFQLNNKRFSSLLEPSGILEHYPNLAITDQIAVDAITLETFCDDIQLPEKKSCLLVLELQGEEANILAKTPQHILQNFKWIVVRSSKEPLYGIPSAPAEAAIQDTLINAKFDSLCFIDDIPIFCSYLFIRNDAELANKALENEKEAALTSIQSLTDDILHLSNQISDLTKEKELLDSKISETSDSLNATQAELAGAHNQISELTKEKELLDSKVSETSDSLNATQTELASAHNQISELTKEKELLDSKTSETVGLLHATQTEFGNARDQLNELTSEKNRLQQQINDISETLNTTLGELDTTQIKVQNLIPENTQQQQRIEELTASYSESINELKEANHALRINNKLVAKNDADLRDLQTRYRTAIDNQKQQHSLLLGLQEKLKQAAKFYRQLNIQDQNIEGDVFGNEIEAIESESDKRDNDQVV